MSHTRCLYHIVFATSHRQPTIPKAHKRDLYAYINGIAEKLKCKVIRINGVTDHIHLLVDLNPTVALSDFVMKIKTATSLWIKHNPLFPFFSGWAAGYFAETLSSEGIDGCKRYIINQEEHHSIYNFSTEVDKMAERNNFVLYKPES